MPPRLADRLSRWAPLAVAALWLLLGWAWLVRGAAHPGVPYRPWAFDHHAYSDLLAMAGDRYFGGGRPIPYLEDRIEYPPLLGLLLWLPSFVPGGPVAYFTTGYVLLAACGLAVVAMLARTPGASPWWLAGTPALAYYGGLNWDLAVIALATAALVALLRGRAAASGALLALGISAKLWPAALLPAAAGWLAGRRGWKALAPWAAALAVVAAAVNLPVALAAPESWAHFWRFNASRAAENSAWEVLRLWSGPGRLAADAAFLNRAVVLLLLPVAAFAAWGAHRGASPAPQPAGSGRALRLGAALVLVAWIAVNKVWSPQYALYAFAAGALAAAPGWLFWLHAGIAAADYHVAFEARASRGLVRVMDPLYVGEELVRILCYALLAAWIARELWREARRAGSGPTAGLTEQGVAQYR